MKRPARTIGIAFVVGLVPLLVAGGAGEALATGAPAAGAPVARVPVGVHAGVRLSSDVLDGATGTGAIQGRLDGTTTGLCVTALALAGPAGLDRPAATGVVRRGTYALSGLAPGSYHLRFAPCTPSHSSPSAATTSRPPFWYGRQLAGTGYEAAATESAAVAVPVRGGLVTPDRILRLPIELAAGAVGMRGLVQRATAVTGWRVSVVPATAGGAATDRDGSISGRVTGKGHKPVGGICVVAFPWLGGIGRGATTKSNGSYTVGHLAAGKWSVQFATGCGNHQPYLQQSYGGTTLPPGLPVTVRAGRTTSGIDVQLVLGGTLDALVTSGGTKVSGLCGTLVGIWHGVEWFLGGVVSNGHFDNTALPPTGWRLEIGGACGVANGNFAPQWYDNEPTQGRATMIKLRSGRVTHVHARLLAGGIVHGRVVDASGAGIGGICVTASNAVTDLYGWGSSGVTSPDGDFAVESLPSGTFAVSFQAQCGNTGNWVAGQLTDVVVVAARSTTLKAFRMEEGGAISGTVVDAAGPVAGVCAQLTSTSGAEESAPVITASNGSYELRNLAPGSRTVGFFPGCGGTGPNLLAQWYDNAPTPELAKPVAVVAGATTTGIDASLLPGGVLSGTVTNSRGAPIEGVCIFALPALGDGLGEIVQSGEQTGQNGSYRVVGLPTGAYEVFFDACSSDHVSEVYGGGGEVIDNGFALPGSNNVLVSVVAGHETRGINASLQTDGTMAGTVLTANGGSPQFLCVLLGNRAGDLVDQEFGVQFSHGRYEAAVPPGSYSVGFFNCGAGNWAPQWWHDSSTQLGATFVTIRPGETISHIDAVLPLGGIISGRMHATTGLGGTCVVAYTGNEIEASSTAAADGSYLLNSLPTGDYTVIFDACDSLQDFAQTTYPRLVKVRVGRTTAGIDTTLAPAGSITGSVSSASPAGTLAGVCVAVFTDESGGLNETGEAISNAAGRYRVSGLPAGPAYVAFDATCGAYGLWAPQWNGGTTGWKESTPVTVVPGTTASGVDASLEPDGTVSGTVVNSSSEGLSGICVTAFRLEGILPEQPTETLSTTDAAGSYSIAGLPAGSYKVEFTDSCGSADLYATQWYDNEPTEQQGTVVTVSAGATSGDIDATMSAPTPGTRAPVYGQPRYQSG